MIVTPIAVGWRSAPLFDSPAWSVSITVSRRSVGARSLVGRPARHMKPTEKSAAWPGRRVSRPPWRQCLNQRTSSLLSPNASVALRWRLSPQIIACVYRTARVIVARWSRRRRRKNTIMTIRRIIWSLPTASHFFQRSRQKKALSAWRWPQKTFPALIYSSLFAKSGSIARSENEITIVKKKRKKHVMTVTLHTSSNEL